MDRELFEDVSGVHRAVGYSHAARAGTVVYVAGQVARGPDGTVVGEGDIELQARQTYANIAKVLGAVGASWEHVVRTTIYLTDRDHVEPFRSVRREVLGAAALPPATLLIVQGLAHPALLIEIDVTAVLPNPRDTD